MSIQPTKRVQVNKKNMYMHQMVVRLTRKTLKLTWGRVSLALINNNLNMWYAFAMQLF